MRDEPILVVDDDGAMRWLIALALRELPVEVVEADGVEAALRWISAVRFKLVLADMEMPGARRVRSVNQPAPDWSWPSAQARER